MKTLIVHLKGNQPRLAHMLNQIVKFGLDDIEWIYAFDGNNYSPPNRTLASLHTHRAATEVISKHNIGPVLILEDDAVLCDSFVPKLHDHINRLSKSIPDWEVAFIGYNTQGDNRWNTVIEGWRIMQPDSPVTFSGGWAYVINGKAAADKLLDLMDETVADWPFHDMMLKDLINTGKVKAAWLCFRLADHGWFESTIKHYENNAIGETLPQYLKPKQ